MDRHRKRTVALDRQFPVGSIVAYYHHLGGRKFVAVFFVNPSLHRGDDFRILERIDMIVATAILSVGREEASVVWSLEGHSEIIGF